MAKATAAGDATVDAGKPWRTDGAIGVDSMEHPIRTVCTV